MPRRLPGIVQRKHDNILPTTNFRTQFGIATAKEIRQAVPVLSSEARISHLHDASTLVHTM